MRAAGHWLVLSIILTGALAAQSLSGYQVEGTITLTTARGPVAGTVSVSFAAPDLCKAVLDFSSPARPRRITAVFDGKQGAFRGPALLMNTAPLPIGPRMGCALLVPRLAGTGVSLSAVPGTVQAASLGWQRGKRKIELTYSYASRTAALPSGLTETVDGATRMKIALTSVKRKTFTRADFALPAGRPQ